MQQIISKSLLKSHILEYLRKVEKTKEPLIVTHGGKTVLKISPYQENPEKILKSLRGSVIYYKDPSEPVGKEDWEALK